MTMAPEKIAKIIELYKRGFTHRAIASTVGCSLGSVDNTLRRQKVPRIPRRCRVARRFGINTLDYYDEDIISGH